MRYERLYTQNMNPEQSFSQIPSLPYRKQDPYLTAVFLVHACLVPQQFVWVVGQFGALGLKSSVQTRPFYPFIDCVGRP
jgi:hypothetical protein